MNSFDKVIGYEDIKAELIRFCDVLGNPEKYRKLGVTAPKGVLLDGEPGIGKTLLAECFIENTGRKSFLIRKDKPNGAFVDYIREIFEKARAEAPCIIFLDDMDKFANEDSYHKDAEEYVAVQSCIDGVKNDDVFIIATINDKDNLPDSLMRAGRFDKVIKMKAPEGDDAEKIIAFYLNQKQTVAELEVGEVARLMEGHSCAELEALINEAGIYAAYKGKEYIEREDILKACMRIIFGAPECMNPKDNPFLEYVAIHEAGHTVVAEVLEPGRVSLVSICRHSGQVEGVTQVRYSEGKKFSKELYEYEILRMLGGRAAIDVIKGITDMGSNRDINKVVGMVSELFDSMCIHGFDMHDDINMPQAVYEKRTYLISCEIEKYYQRARRILIENRDFLLAVTDALLKKQTLTCRDIKDIRSSLAY